MNPVLKELLMPDIAPFARSAIALKGMDKSILGIRANVPAKARPAFSTAPCIRPNCPTTVPAALAMPRNCNPMSCPAR